MNRLVINKLIKLMACLLISKRVNRVPTQHSSFVLSLFNKYCTQNLLETYYIIFFVPNFNLVPTFYCGFLVEEILVHGIIFLNLYKSQVTHIPKKSPLYKRGEINEINQK